MTVHVVVPCFNEAERLDIDFRFRKEGLVRQFGNGRRADGTEVTAIRQYERGEAMTFAGPGCVVSRASAFTPADEADIDEVILAAAVDLASESTTVETSGLPDGLAARVELATAGDVDEATRLITDSLFPLFSSEGRIISTTPAIETAIEQAATIGERVSSTFVLVADPPVGC